MTTQMIKALSELNRSQTVSGTKRQAEATEKALKKTDKAAK
jgi:hypothetical protein